MSRPTPLQFGFHDTDLGELIIRLQPAPEVWEWIQTQILADTGSIHNEDHAHLIDADIQVMWASASFEKQGRRVFGQAEPVMCMRPAKSPTQPRKAKTWCALKFKRVPVLAF